VQSDRVLEATVEGVIFQNSENGYTVFTVSVTNDKEIDGELTCVGMIPNLNEGEFLRMTGSFVMHPTYGKQFNVADYTKSVPTSLSGIEKYLASGLIKGIGEKMAKKIVEEFKEDTLDIIENYPEQLANLKGITLEKAMTISAIFHEQVHLRQAMMFLQSYGISPTYALKIYKKYKERTVEIVKENPYALADDIIGIGFKIADSIAYRMGISEASNYRVRAGIKYTLSLATNNGHVYLPRQALIEKVFELLNVSEGLIENEITSLMIEKSIVSEVIGEETCIYLNAFFYAESYVAKKLLEISLNAIDKSSGMEEEIEKVEKELNISLAVNQKEAVINALINGVTVITGGPGTGKTTTINTIINLLKKEGLEIELAAPTGRAAKRMTEATGHEAKTIHRLLEVKFMSEDSNRQSFEKNEDNPIEADVIIIDECSMVDCLLMFNLLKAVGEGSRLILVGDSNQLPSVGPGNVLKDIIASGAIKTVELSEIFRQAQESAIVMNAHRINQGEYPEVNEKESDFFFVKRLNADEAINTMLEMALRRIPKSFGLDFFKDIQILTPMRKSALGINNLNKILQQAYNPPKHHKSEFEYRQTIFREGDKVMQIKNNYATVWKIYDSGKNLVEEGTGVFNGDEGIIERIDKQKETMKVIFDEEKVVEYDFTQLDELDLSYAITIHKSQGSEYKAVIIPIHSGPYMLLNRNLLYTALTRAKQLVVIIGSFDTVKQMVDNNRELARFSALSYRIKKFSKIFGNSNL